MTSCRLASVVATLVAAPLVLCGCGSSDSADSGTSQGKKKIVTSFYPLQFAAQQIGGDKVNVTSLTKPGQEPHDIDPSPKQIASLSDADLAIYVKGFQTHVDEAVASTAKKDRTLDVASAADMNLKLSSTTSIGGKDEAEGDEHDHGTDTDPHFWLDPIRYKSVVQAVGARMAESDPANKATYEANTKALVTELDALDRDYQSGLAGCTNKTLVTGHAAFGYLAHRYGFTQVGVTGISPDAEPTPKRLEDVAAFVKKNHVTTIYSETLVSPKTAQTVASATGATVEVLDPIEGLTDASKGTTYLEVMKSNLDTLKKGQRCS